MKKNPSHSSVIFIDFAVCKINSVDGGEMLLIEFLSKKYFFVLDKPVQVLEIKFYMVFTQSRCYSISCKEDTHDLHLRKEYVDFSILLWTFFLITVCFFSIFLSQTPFRRDLLRFCVYI